MSNKKQQPKAAPVVRTSRPSKKKVNSWWNPASPTYWKNPKRSPRGGSK